MILAISDLQAALILPTKFQVNWSFSSKEEAQNRFSRWQPWRAAWIFGSERLLLVFIYKLPRCFLPSFKPWPFGSGEEAKNRFSRWQPLAIFLTMSLRSFLPSFKSIGLLVQEKKRKINFQDGCHSGHLGFLIRTILAIFDLQITRMLPIKFNKSFKSIGLSFQEKKQNIDFQDGGHLLVTPMPQTKFESTCSIVQEELLKM